MSCCTKRVRRVNEVVFFCYNAMYCLDSLCLVVGIVY